MVIKTMKSISLLFAAGGVAISSVAHASSPQKLDGQKPNVLLIMVDDLGLGDLSCQYVRDLQTPNIDKLFSDGVRLNNFYASSSVSSPSRAGLLTGCYPDMVGVPGVIRTEPTASWGYLSPEATLLPQMMKKAEYNTAIIGKWHLGLEEPNLPNSRGFDFFHGFLGDMMDNYYTHLRRGHNYMRLNEEVIEPTGHATDLFSSWALDYFDTMRKSKVPFFLYLAYNAPHVPLQPPTEWLERVRKREPGISEKRAKLVALIEHLDYNIGRVYKALEKSGQLDNTLIIFCSDNGGDAGAEANNGPVRGSKGDMYEGGIKVPCAVYWRNHLKPRSIDDLVIMSDIFPTLCDLVNVPVNHRIDGISLLPLFLGEKQCTDDRMIFWVRREHAELGGKTQNAVRYKNYKLLQNRSFDALEYFDLEKDSCEIHSMKKDDMYTKLYRGMIDHYRMSGSVPWQKPLKY